MATEKQGKTEIHPGSLHGEAGRDARWATWKQVEQCSVTEQN